MRACSLVLLVIYDGWRDVCSIVVLSVWATHARTHARTERERERRTHARTHKHTHTHTHTHTGNGVCIACIAIRIVTFVSHHEIADRSGRHMYTFFIRLCLRECQLQRGGYMSTFNHGLCESHRKTIHHPYALRTAGLARSGSPPTCKNGLCITIPDALGARSTMVLFSHKHGI